MDEKLETVVLKKVFFAFNKWEELFLFVGLYQRLKKVSGYEQIEKKDISYILFSKKPKYKSYELPKKQNGKTRLIEAPTYKLKVLQRIINDSIQLCFTPRSAAHGFIRERSIVTNAQEHIGKKYVYNIDLEDFFPSIHFGRVRGVFQSHPFEFSAEKSKILANICCNNGRLPQGAPTSPVVSNLVCRNLDRKLSQIAKVYKAKYTRYADDITFSCNTNIFDEVFFQRLNMVIEAEGFKINREKERLQTSLERQMVTGLVVNKKLNTPPQYKKELRFLINLWKKYGKDKAQEWLEQNYDKRHRYNGKVPDIEQVISGKLAYFKMVSGQKRDTYQALEFKYNCAKAGIDLSFSDVKEAEVEITTLIGKLERSLSDFEDSILLDLKEQLNVLGKALPKNSVYIRGEKVFQDFLARKDSLLGTAKYKTKPPVNPFPIINTHVNLQDSGQTEYSKRGKSYPQYHAMFLSLFRDNSHPFGRLSHRNETEFNKLIEEGVAAFKAIGKAIAKGPSKKRIRPELYAIISAFLNALDSDKDLEEKFTGRSYKDAFSEIEEIITPFKKLIRFGSNNDELKISELLLYQMQNTQGFFDDYWFLSIPKNIDSKFQDVFSSVKNISEAFSIIFSGFLKHSNGVGAVKITVHEWNNRTVLRIIDCRSKSRKTSEELERGLRGGDLQRLASLLAGYCDLNIRGIFPQGQFQKITLLPAPVKSGISENYKPEGFTYELIFYRPIKVLLLDDIEEENRSGRAKKLLEENLEYGSILDIKKALEDINSLSGYNAVFIHTSAKEYSRVKEYVINNKMPIINFSGGKSFHKESEYNMTMTDEVFYSSLKDFCHATLESGEFSLAAFEKDYSTPEINKREGGEDSKRKILDDIAIDKLDCANLPDEIINRIKNLIPEGEGIPSFRTRKSIEQFLTKYAQS